jgi:hypothetical protein
MRLGERHTFADLPITSRPPPSNCSGLLCQLAGALRGLVHMPAFSNSLHHNVQFTIHAEEKYQVVRR